MVKVYNNVARGVLSAIIDEAHRLDMLVFGHVPRAEGRTGALEHALAAGLDVITHGEEFFFTRFYGGIEEALDEDPRRDLNALTRMTGLVLHGRWIDAGTLESRRPTWPHDPDPD